MSESTLVCAICLRPTSFVYLDQATGGMIPYCKDHSPYTYDLHATIASLRADLAAARLAGQRAEGEAVALRQMLVQVNDYYRLIVGAYQERYGEDDDMSLASKIGVALAASPRSAALGRVATATVASYVDLKGSSVVAWSEPVQHLIAAVDALRALDADPGATGTEVTTDG